MRLYIHTRDVTLLLFKKRKKKGHVAISDDFLEDAGTVLFLVIFEKLY